MEISHDELKELIKIAYAKKLPLHIMGHIGIGKSDTVKNTAKELAEELKMQFLDGFADGGFGFIDVRLSQLEPSDLRGLPMYDKDNHTTEWYIPNWLPQKGSGILFFDELNLALPSIQAAAYQLILNRQIGTYKLPDGWNIVAAGNGSDDRGNTFEIPSPLANRFIHTLLKVPNCEDWTNWALENKINSDIVAFINFKPSYLYKFNEETSQLAFPTPRSWEFCSRLLSNQKTKHEKILIASAIGDGVATEFLAFRKLKNSLDIDRILENADEFKNPQEVDMKYALISAISERYKAKKTILPKIVKIWTKMDPEFVVLSLRILKSEAGRNLGPDLFKIKEWTDLGKEYSKFFL